MNHFFARVTIRPKAGVLDPQGEAVEQGLAALGYAGLSRTQVGRLVEMQLEAESEAAARDQLQAMADKLLANTLIEDYEIEVQRA